MVPDCRMPLRLPQTMSAMNPRVIGTEYGRSDPTADVIDPWQIFDDYSPQLPPYAVSSLDLARPEDFVTLCVVVVTAGAEEMTMNLLAPVVINLVTRTGRQVTLETGGYSVRTPIPRKAPPAAGAQAS